MWVKDFSDDKLLRYPPFIGKNDDEVISKVKKGIYEFDEDEEWGTISTEAKDLIKKCIILDPSKRISARLAFDDLWV